MWEREHDTGKHVSESDLKCHAVLLLESVPASCHPRVWCTGNTQQVFDESDWILSVQDLNRLLGTPYPAQHQHQTQCFVHYKHSTNICGRDGWLREEVPFSLRDRLLYICETYQNEENEVPTLTPKEKKVCDHASAPKGYPPRPASPSPMKLNIWNLGHGFKESPSLGFVVW